MIGHFLAQALRPRVNWTEVARISRANTALLLATSALLAHYPEFMQALDIQHPALDFLARHPAPVTALSLTATLHAMLAEMPRPGRLV